MGTLQYVADQASDMPGSFSPALQISSILCGSTETKSVGSGAHSGVQTMGLHLL